MTYTSYTTSFFCTAHFLPSMTTVCKWPSVGCGSSFSFFGLNGSSKERDDSEWIQLYNPPTTQTGPRPIICLNFTELGSNWNSLPEIKSAQSSLIWPNTAYYYSYAYIYKKKHIMYLTTFLDVWFLSNLLFFWGIRILHLPPLIQTMFHHRGLEWLCATKKPVFQRSCCEMGELWFKKPNSGNTFSSNPKWATLKNAHITINQ